MRVDELALALSRCPQHAQIYLDGDVGELCSVAPRRYAHDFWIVVLSGDDPDASQLTVDPIMDPIITSKVNP